MHWKLYSGVLIYNPAKEKDTQETKTPPKQTKTTKRSKQETFKTDVSVNGVASIQCTVFLWTCFMKIFVKLILTRTGTVNDKFMCQNENLVRKSKHQGQDRKGGRNHVGFT